MAEILTDEQILQATDPAAPPADRLSDADLQAVLADAPDTSLGRPREFTSPTAPLAVKAAMDAIAGVSGRNRPSPSTVFGQSELYRAAKRPGVPLELESFGMGSVDPWTRLQAERRKNQQEQLDYLNAKLGPGKARIPQGQKDIIVTIPDPVNQGKEKDVLLNEDNLTLNDFVALGKHIPAVAGALLGTMIPGPGIVKLLGGSVGTKVGEAVSEIEQKAEVSKPLEIGETLIQKSTEIPTQAVMDTATLGLFKGFNLLQKTGRAPLGFWQTPVQLEGNAANLRLADKFGVEPIRMTPGQASGNPLAILLEAYAKAKPQARAYREAFDAAQEADKQAMGRAMTAFSGTDEQVGQDLMNVLKQTRAEKDAAIEGLRQTLTAQEAATLDKAIQRSVPMPRSFKPSEAGAEAGSGFRDLFETVKAKVGKAYDIPGMKTPDIPTGDLSDGLAKIAKEAEGIPGLSGVIDRELPELTSFEQLKNGRAMSRQKIEDSPADRTVKDYYAGKVDAAYTAKMEDAATNIRDPGFKKALGTANKMYRTEQLPFYQEGLGDILRKPGVPGSPENMEILNRFSGNTDLYRRLVSVAGKNSTPVKLVNQSMVDGLLTKSGTEAIDSSFVNFKNLVENLTDLKTNPKTREMFNDVFGANGDRIINQARVAGAVQGTIPREEAEALLTGGIAKGKSAKNVQAMLEEQKTISRDYTTALLKGEPLNPQTFVNRVMDVATPSELSHIKKQVLDKDPGVLEMVQDKVVENILGKVGSKLDKTSLLKVIDDPSMYDKYRLVLGDKFSNLKDFASVLGNIESAESIAEGTGMLVKGQSIGSLARMFRPGTGGKGSGIGAKALAEVPGWIGWKALTRVILSGPVRSWAAKSTPEDLPNLVQAAVLSEPVLEDLLGKPTQVVKSHVVTALRYLRLAGSQTQSPGAQSNQPHGPLTDEEILRLTQ